MAQRDIVNELTELTALLKENTLAMSQSVQQQNLVREIFSSTDIVLTSFGLQQLDLMQKHAQENYDELAEQKKKVTCIYYSLFLNFSVNKTTTITIHWILGNCLDISDHFLDLCRNVCHHPTLPKTIVSFSLLFVLLISEILVLYEVYI